MEFLDVGPLGGLHQLEQTEDAFVLVAIGQEAFFWSFRGIRFELG